MHEAVALLVFLLASIVAVATTAHKTENCATISACIVMLVAILAAALFSI